MYMYQVYRFNQESKLDIKTILKLKHYYRITNIFEQMSYFEEKKMIKT